MECVCGRKAFHGTSTKDHQWRPPQLAASFISNQACDVAYWHFADKPTAPAFVRNWSNSEQE
jgi:hypothetical protein